jgi:hypothetical protein
MKTMNRDLQPGSFEAANGSSFELSVSVWRAVDDFLTKVAAVQTTAKIDAAIPAFAVLKAAAVKWKWTTLPNLFGLLQDIYGYGDETVARRFPRLKQLLQTMQSEIPANAAADFHRIMSEILEEAEENTELAISIAKDLETIDTSVQAVKQQIEDYMADTVGGGAAEGKEEEEVALISALGNRLPELASLLSAFGTPPRTDVERVRGAWSSLADDLNGFQSTVKQEIATSNPFLAELNLDVAISEWRDLAEEAQQLHESLRGL